MKIRNWKLALLALIFFSLFIFLGFWQISRANQKKILLQSYAERAQHSPLLANDLLSAQDHRFYQARLQGTFDNEHSFLLDNKIYQDMIGYELYTPFHAIGLKKPILIDRGFIAMGPNREILPEIKKIIGVVTISGMLNNPPTYVAFGAMAESATNTWPLRVEYINLNEISTLQKESYFPYVLTLTPKDPAAYAIEWQIVAMGPERHMGYALQWFAFATTLLILFVALNRKPGANPGTKK